MTWKIALGALLLAVALDDRADKMNKRKLMAVANYSLEVPRLEISALTLRTHIRLTRTGYDATLPPGRVRRQKNFERHCRQNYHE